MKIVPCGSKVTSKINNIEGIVTAACIRFNLVNYEISYFSGQDYKQIWLTEAEFDFTDKKKSIGFNQK